MEFYAGGEGTLRIHYPHERTLEGLEVVRWLSQQDARVIVGLIQRRQKRSKENLLVLP